MIKQLIQKLTKDNPTNINTILGEGFTSHRGMNGLFALKNSKGAIVTQHIYKEISSIKYGLFKVKNKNNLYGFINRNGEEIIVPQFENAKDFHCRRATVGDGKRVGIINLKGEFIIPVKYKILDTEDGVIVAQGDKGWVAFDLNGNKIENNENVGYSLPPFSPMVIYLRGLGGGRTYPLIKLEYDYLLNRNSNFANLCYEVKEEQSRYSLNKKQYNMDAESYKKYRAEKEEELHVLKENLLSR